METESSRRKWSVLALLFTVGALNYADRTAISSVFPLLRRDLAISDVGLAAIGSLFLWSYAATSPIAGIIADRVSRSRLVVISLAGWSVVTAATGLVTGSGQLFGLRVLLGIAECLYLPAALGLLADYHASDTRATALGIHSAGLSLGMIAGGTAAGFLGERFGWRPSFLILGATGLVLAGIATLWLRDPEPSGQTRVEAEPMGTTIASLFRVPTYGIILAEAALIAISNWIFANWLPLYFRETYGLTLAAAGFSGTFALTAGVVSGATAGGYLSDRVARGDVRRRLLMQGVLYAFSAPLLLVFLGHAPAGVLGCAILAHGFLRGLGSINELPILCDLLPSHRRSTAFGFMNAMNTFVGGGGVLISGFLKSDSGLTQVFVGLTGVVLLASVVSLIGYKWVLPKDLARKSVLRTDFTKKRTDPLPGQECRIGDQQ